MSLCRASCRRFSYLLLLILFFCLLTPEPVWAKNTIIWLNDNLPPAFISEGPEKGQGIVDGVVEIYKKHLPAYKHEHLAANMPRILEMMRKGENVCYAGFFKTPEREEFICFSRPNLLAITNGVVMKKSRAKELIGNRKSVSLEELLKNKDLRAGITRDRAYGEQIDNILDKYKKDHANLVQRAGADSIRGLLKMLDNDRIDYALGFPWEVPYVSGQLGIRDRFVMLPIKEASGHQWTLNYIGCPKTPWGCGAIEEINQVLEKVLQSKEHMHYQLRWFPESMEPQIREACERLLFQNTGKQE